VATELPKPEELVAALASFPPKLSVLVKPFTIPEEMFENAVKSATGVEPPPGPSKTVKMFMESFEVSMPAAAPSLPLPVAKASEETAVTRPARFEII
jgi:hypothetical protein